VILWLFSDGSYVYGLFTLYNHGITDVYIHIRKHIVRPRELVSHIAFRTKKYVSSSIIRTSCACCWISWRRLSVHYRVVVGFKYIIAFLINQMTFYMVLF
jgi:hypothetical protein